MHLKARKLWAVITIFSQLSPALTLHKELCLDIDPANATQSMVEWGRGAGRACLVSLLLGTHLTLRQSNSQRPITYAWRR